MGGWWGQKVGKMVVLNFSEGGQDGGSEFLKRKHWDVLGQVRAFQVFKLAEMKGNAQQTSLFYTAELCSHTQSSSLPFGPPGHSYGSLLCYRKAASKIRPLSVQLVLNVKFEVYSYTIVFIVRNQI